MTKRLFVGALLAVGCVLLSQQQASAHVLLRDDSKSVGAVLHITPDDDPVAGQPASLYFDIQSQVRIKKYATLTIVNLATRAEETVPVAFNDSLMIAQYTFPNQGAYELTLVVMSSQSYTFTYAQRVSRGAQTGVQLAAPYYPLAHLTLILSAGLFLTLLIIGINHRQAIHRSSAF